MSQEAESLCPKTVKWKFMMRLPDSFYCFWLRSCVFALGSSLPRGIGPTGRVASIFIAVGLFCPPKPAPSCEWVMRFRSKASLCWTPPISDLSCGALLGENLRIDPSSGREPGGYEQKLVGRSLRARIRSASRVRWGNSRAFNDDVAFRYFIREASPLRQFVVETRRDGAFVSRGTRPCPLCGQFRLCAWNEARVLAR